jgi:hypothetical protein
MSAHANPTASNIASLIGRSALTAITSTPFPFLVLLDCEADRTLRTLPSQR